MESTVFDGVLAGPLQYYIRQLHDILNLGEKKDSMFPKMELLVGPDYCFGVLLNW